MMFKSWARKSCGSMEGVNNGELDAGTADIKLNGEGTGKWGSAVMA